MHQVRPDVTNVPASFSFLLLDARKMSAAERAQQAVTNAKLFYRCSACNGIELTHESAQNHECWGATLSLL